MKPGSCHVLACDVLDKEIERFAEGLPHIAEIEKFEMGLHDRPDFLRTTLQKRIHELEEIPTLETIILIYGLCGNALVGIGSKRLSLVLPRAHDCITLFLGSKETYAERRKCHCEEYYYTPGWQRGDRVPRAEKFEELRLKFTEQFDEEDAEYLVEMEKQFYQPYDTATYIDLDNGTNKEAEAYARQCADSMKWKFQTLQGDPTLLKDLLAGNWDESRFCIVAPGEVTVSSIDSIVKSAPGEPPVPPS